jgi:WD40 repeat protein
VLSGKQICVPWIDKDDISTAVYNSETNRILVMHSFAYCKLLEILPSKKVRMLMNHEEESFHATFSPDGKKIAAEIFLHSVQVWNALNGKIIGTPMEHQGNVMSIVFSPDSKYILTASVDNTARLWDAATARQIGPSMQHNSYVLDAIFSPDGKYILTNCKDKTTQLWETGSGRKIGAAIKHANETNRMYFDSNTMRILFGCRSSDTTTMYYFKDIEGDLDIPADLFKLQAECLTGTELNKETNEMQLINATKWYQINDEYYIKGKKHYTECKYQKYNLWYKLYPMGIK